MPLAVSIAALHPSEGTAPSLSLKVGGGGKHMGTLARNLQGGNGQMKEADCGKETRTAMRLMVGAPERGLFRLSCVSRHT